MYYHLWCLSDSECHGYFLSCVNIDLTFRIVSCLNVKFNHALVVELPMNLVLLPILSWSYFLPFIYQILAFDCLVVLVSHIHYMEFCENCMVNGMNFDVL